MVRTRDQISKPLDAACLLLYRMDECNRDKTTPNKVQVLLGRRPVNSSFMPDVFVFPGGGLEAPDGRISPATPLDDRFTARLAVANKPNRATALALAAVRETFEETGLMIATTGTTGETDHPSWQAFRAQNLGAHLASLSYIGRAITPASQPKRFHARFFGCNAANIEGLLDQPVRGNGELLDLDWFSLEATRALSMRSVTRFMLEQLIERLNSNNPDWIGDKIYTHRKGKLTISRQPPTRTFD